MLMMILFSLLTTIVQMAVQVCFFSVLAYCVARMARIGWKAGK